MNEVKDEKTFVEKFSLIGADGVPFYSANNIYENFLNNFYKETKIKNLTFQKNCDII